MGTKGKQNKQCYSLALFQHQRREQELRRQQECEQRWAEAKDAQRREERCKEDKRAVEDDERFIADGQRKPEKKQVWKGLLAAICSSLFLWMSFSVPLGLLPSSESRIRERLFNAFTASCSRIQPFLDVTCKLLTELPPWAIAMTLPLLEGGSSVTAVSPCWSYLQSLQSDLRYLYPESFQHKLNLSLNLQSLQFRFGLYKG